MDRFIADLTDHAASAHEVSRILHRVREIGRAAANSTTTSSGALEGASTTATPETALSRTVHEPSYRGTTPSSTTGSVGDRDAITRGRGMLPATTPPTTNTVNSFVRTSRDASMIPSTPPPTTTTMGIASQVTRDSSIVPTTPSSKRRLSSTNIDIESPSPIRRQFAGLMSRPSPVKARQIIEDAFRRIDRELKKPYRSEYPVNTGVPFLKLGYDVYAIILNKLTGDRIFDVSAQMRRDNAPKALRRVNIQMNAITREWMANSMKVRVKPQLRLPYLETKPLTQSFKFVISPVIGVFNARTSTFFLDCAFMEGPNEADLIVERNLMLARLVTFCSDRTHEESVQNIRLRVRKAGDFFDFMTYFEDFKNLQKVEVLGVSAYPNFNYMVWEFFWELDFWCHPGHCCSCCAPPELITIDATSGTATAIPAPLRQTYEQTEEDWAHLVQSRNKAWYTPHPNRQRRV